MKKILIVVVLAAAALGWWLWRSSPRVQIARVIDEAVGLVEKEAEESLATEALTARNLSLLVEEPFEASAEGRKTWRLSRQDVMEIIRYVRHEATRIVLVRGEEEIDVTGEDQATATIVVDLSGSEGLRLPLEGSAVRATASFRKGDDGEWRFSSLHLASDSLP